MAQLGKGKLNYRCPSCFLRDLDIDMFYNKETRNLQLHPLSVQRNRGGRFGEKRDDPFPL